MKFVTKVLKNDLGRIGKAYRSALEDESKAAAERVRDGWKRRAHVVTGRYRDSITAEKQGDKTWLVRSGVPYDVYEEYGTRHRPPHPAFEPAKEEEARNFPQSTSKRLRGIR